MKRNDYVIRKAKTSDLNQVKALADAHKSELGFVIRSALVKSINNSEIFIATCGEKLVGFVDYHHRRDKQTTLYKIVVATSQRRSGLGRQLVQSLVEEAKERDKHYILLKCPEDLEANKFYKALNFQLHETQPGKHRKLNIWRWML